MSQDPIAGRHVFYPGNPAFASLNAACEGGIKEGELFLVHSSLIPGRTTMFRQRVFALARDRATKGNPVFVITANQQTKAMWIDMFKDEAPRVMVMTVLEFIKFTSGGADKPEFQNTMAVIDEIHDVQRKTLKAKMFKTLNVRELVYQPERFEGSDVMASYNRRDDEELPSDGPR